MALKLQIINFFQRNKKFMKLRFNVVIELHKMGNGLRSKTKKHEEMFLKIQLLNIKLNFCWEEKKN